MRKISLKKLAKLGGVMPRSSITSPRRPIKAKKRKPSNFARIYGSRERVKWVKLQPCFACGVHAGGEIEIVNAHTENGGAGRKADYDTIIPLCSRPDANGCHEWQHRYGWQMLMLHEPDKRKAAAAKTEAAWLAHLNRTAPETADDR